MNSCKQYVEKLASLAFGLYTKRTPALQRRMFSSNIASSKNDIGLPKLEIATLSTKPLLFTQEGSPTIVEQVKSHAFMVNFCDLNQKLNCQTVIGDSPIKKGYLDPRSIMNFEIEVPSIDDTPLILPTNKDKELIEPVANIVDKQAARLIVIRRIKMNKHKWRKLQKKMKFVFAKRRQRRELRKEKAFQAVLIDKIKTAQKFNAQQYVAEKLAKAHWTPPVNKVGPLLCPDWVVQEHLQKLKDEAVMKERIDKCLRMKK